MRLQVSTSVCAISDAISTSTSPSDNHRFVRLFFTDASQGVQSVRPAHRGVSSGRGEVVGGWTRSPVRGYVPEEIKSVSISDQILNS